jgi:hypothetical protein
MHATARALLDAHTRHVMQQLSGAALDALIDAETASFCDWLAARPVTALADAATVRDFLLRNVFDITPGERLLEQIGTLATRALQSPLNAKTKLNVILDEREYNLIASRLIAMEDTRRNLVHAVMQNPGITHLISDIVYNGVKNYVAENSNIAKKVPGMSSLMKLGKGVMETMGTDSMVENALKGYVRHNTRATMEMSERLVLQALETPKLQAAAHKLWKELHGMPLEKVTRHVSAAQVDEAVVIGNALWNHFRKTPYARKLLAELVEAWFEQWGQDPVLTVLETIGLDRARLPGEVKEFLQPLVAELTSSGHLEARVRAHLEPFYASAEVGKLLGG